MEAYHLERLKKLADYLIFNDNIDYKDPVPISFEGIEDAYGVIVVFYFYEWVFKDAPFLFHHWSKRDNRSVYESVGESQGVVWSVIIYFGLTIDYFLHLFCLGFQQPHLFGGNILKRGATAAELSHNIIQFILKMEL